MAMGPDGLAIAPEEVLAAHAVPVDEVKVPETVFFGQPSPSTEQAIEEPLLAAEVEENVTGVATAIVEESAPLSAGLQQEAAPQPEAVPVTVGHGTAGVDTSASPTALEDQQAMEAVEKQSEPIQAEEQGKQDKEPPEDIALDISDEEAPALESPVAAEAEDAGQTMTQVKRQELPAE